MAVLNITPGAYSRFIRTPGTVVLSASTRIPAIIGVGETTITVENEEVTRASGAYGTDQTESFTYTATDILTVGSVPNYAEWTEGTDYQLTDGGIEWIITGDEPVNGTVYFVTYKRTKVTADYAAKLKTSLTDVIDEYGSPTISNTLSLGANMCFENGAAQIICVQVTADTYAAYVTAIDKLREQVSNLDAYYIIPLSTLTTVVTYLNTHVNLMSSTAYKKERIGLFGMDVASTVAAISARADALSNERLILAYGEFLRDVIDSSGDYSETVIGSQFIACAVAGILAANAIQEPVTRKIFTGFTGLSREFTEVELDAMERESVTVFTSKAGIIRCRHGVTTSDAAVEDQEISVMQIRDEVIKTMRDRMDTMYIPKPITASTTANIVSTIKSILDVYIEQGAIVSYGSVTAVQDSTSPVKINVTYGIFPAYPTNIIMIKHTVTTVA